MEKSKKTGIILIAIGICFPLVLLAFVSGYKDGAGFISNLFALKIAVNISEKFKIGIPYRFFLAFGVALIFFGIRCFDMAKADQAGNDDKL